MKKKPTYEELEKRIEELERERQFEHDRFMSLLDTPDIDGSVSKLETFNDVAGREQAEEKHVVHVRFLENMERVNRVVRQATDVDQMISDVLQTTLEIFDSDRAWVVHPCDPGAASWCAPMERTKPEHTGVFALGEEIPMTPEIEAVFREALNKDDLITVDYRNPGAARENAERFSILSEMHMAVYPKTGKPWLFGVHQCAYYRDWSKEEKDLFREIGRRVGDALSSMIFLRDLRESEARFKAIFNANRDGYAIVMGDGEILDANPRMMEMLGYSKDELKSRGFWKITPGKWRAYEHDVLSSLLFERGHTDLYEKEYIRKDGSIFPIEVQAFILKKGEDLESTMIGGFVRDITERKRAEDALKKNVHELDERVKGLNCFFGLSALREKKGASLEDICQGTVELLSRSWQYPNITCARIILGEKEFKTGNFRETAWKQAAEILAPGKHNGVLEVCYLEERPECDEGPFLKEERGLIDAVAERLGKMIELKLSEEAVLKNERRFRDLIENSPTGIAIIREDNVVYRNSVYKNLVDASEDPSLSVSLENIHPDDVEMVARNYQALVSGEKKRVDMEYRFYPADKAGGGPDMKWAGCMASRIDFEGEDAILVNMTDATLAKELEHILRTQDKMSSLGRVAAGIAHEIRNPLSGVNIYLNTLRKISGGCENHEMINKIASQLQSASNKIESIIKRVMDFSRPSEPRFAPTDINQPVKDAFKLSSVALRKSGIHFTMDLSADLPKREADHHMIEQVVLNLLSNASEAMQHMDKDKQIHISSFPENGVICIKISDSGHGIPKEIRNNILEPFYTTKSGGSGIGLSICHRIITDHGGTLHISDAEQGGAEFTIRFPMDARKGEK